MAELSRQYEAPSEVRFDSARIAQVKASILGLLQRQLAPMGGSRREATVEVAAEPKPDSPDALLHHVLEVIRREHPEYTLRYGGANGAGIITVSILRTVDVALKNAEAELGAMQTAGFLVRGAE